MINLIKMEMAILEKKINLYYTYDHNIFIIIFFFIKVSYGNELIRD